MAPGSQVINQSTVHSQSVDEVHDFTPKGAIAFFILMILMFTVMWFSIYFELIKRI